MNQNKNFWEKSILANNLKVKDAISNLNNTSLKIVIVVDENQNFWNYRWRYKTCFVTELI